jgi:GNAT superfamily N-acetyltransferase
VAGATHLPDRRYLPHRLARAVVRRLYSPATRSVVLRRDLDRPLTPPPAKTPITVRPATAADRARVSALLCELTGYDRSTRERFLELGIGTCYVAVNQEGEICYTQWLVGAEDNDLLASYTHLPTLDRHEALLENAFTPKAFRGQGIMAAAMAQIAGCAVALGARWTLTVVREDNLPSIKGCIKAGFEPYMLKLDGWRLLRHEIRYAELPADYAVPGLPGPGPSYADPGLLGPGPGDAEPGLPGPATQAHR